MKLVRAAVVATIPWYAASAVFHRPAPRALRRRYRTFGNVIGRAFCGLVPGWAVIETTGRRSGLPRRVPVGGRLEDDVFWFVAGDWRHSQFIRNIQADPKVRVQVHGRWRSGKAQLVPSDDPRRRLLRLNPLNSWFVWIAAKDPMTVRVDLD